MRIWELSAIIALLSVMTCFALAGDQGKPQVAGNTKLEVFFAELETQWLKAEQAKDPAALNKIVADDFHMTTAASPGSRVSRSDWLLEAFSRRLLSFNVRQVGVRELGPNIAVVSYIRTETYQQTATPATEEHFVVDIWVNSGAGDNWRCTDRYFSELKKTK